MNEIRWTDKVYLDSQGNIRSSDGCPTEEYNQQLRQEGQIDREYLREIERTIYNEVKDE